MPMNPDFEDPAQDDQPGGDGFDATGLDAMLDIMRGAFQVMTAARITGFSEQQAFQLSRDWFTNMMRFSHEAQQEGPR